MAIYLNNMFRSSPSPMRLRLFWNQARYAATLACLLLIFSQGLQAEVLDSKALRIVLVGDSITGLSRNDGKGFAHVMEKALKVTHPDREIEMIASFGGSQ